MASSINKSVISKILNGEKPPTDVHGVYRIVMKRGKMALAPDSFISSFDKMFPNHFTPAATAPAATTETTPASTECGTTPAPATTPAPTDAAPAPATPAKKRGRPANPDKPVKPPKAVSTTPYRAGSIYDKLTLLCLENDGMSMNNLLTLAKERNLLPLTKTLEHEDGTTYEVPTNDLDMFHSFNAAIGVIRGKTSSSNRGKTECTGTPDAVHLRILSMTPTRPDRDGDMSGMTEEDKASWPARSAAETAAVEEAKQTAAAEKARKAEQDKATKALRKAEKTADKTAKKATADAEKAKKKADAAAAALKVAQDKVTKIQADLDEAKAKVAEVTSAATPATPATPATAETAAPGDSIPAAAPEVPADTVADDAINHATGIPAPEAE